MQYFVCQILTQKCLICLHILNALIIERKFNEINNDRSRTKFWNEKKRMTRNDTLESLVIKDINGMRQYNPEQIMEQTALYYENLYANQPYRPHPYHDEVQRKIKENETNFDHDTLEYNLPPTREEIYEIVLQKKNGKSTTDIRNEMLKRPGFSMIDFLYPLIMTIWQEETIPEQWNEGRITSLWKGKGDKEMLKNHRGITTSSSIGTIVEALIDKRMEKIIPITEAQGGGKKGSSTYDHLFILRAMIDISIKQKRKTYLTFYDVAKAYDHVDNMDMLNIMWDDGLKGKVWRILKNLNTNMKAKVKTRFGLTRQIELVIGGKQGSRTTGRMFAKTMDKLPEKLISDEKGFAVSPTFKIPALAWVDDLVSCVETDENQIEVMDEVDEFGVKHKLEWGAAKCKVMRVGKHEASPKEWKLGQMSLSETTQYRYLGDEVTSNGKNTENIKIRKQKLRATIATINTIASNEVLNQVESIVLLELHERIAIPGFLNNAETWVLNKGETNELERTELQAIKNLYNLPTRTPNAAIIYVFGTLYTRQRIDKSQLLYLHRMLNRPPTHWTTKTLLILEEMNIGWSKNIKQILTYYSLTTDFQEIKATPWPTWKQNVTSNIESKHVERLTDECFKTIDGERTIKTKTASIVPEITSNEYRRKPKTSILKTSKRETRTIMMARFGLLECGKNFKGTQSEMCNQCICVDDENHRLNHCIKWRNINLYDQTEKVDYTEVYSDDLNIVRRVIPFIENVWDTRMSQGRMNNT